MTDKPGLGARRLALAALDGVLNHGRTLEERVAQQALEPHERAFALRLATTALRHKGEAEAALAPLLKSPLPKSAGLTRLILLLAAAELLVLRSPAHAVIDCAVDLAKADRNARHFAGVVNAVLRKAASAPPAPAPAADINTPGWLYARWENAYGPARAREIALSHACEPALDLSVKADAAAWALRLGGVPLPGGSIRLRAPSGAVTSLPGFAEGQWWVQDWAAAQPARLFGAVRGKTILDLCAAPGGKTAQFAAAGAEVTAIDSSAPRVKRLQENLARLELSAQVLCDDLMSFSSTTRFDGVLLDAPCSATGTIRRHPDLPYLKTAGQIGELARLQSRFLDRAARFVKPGGLLVYSTCSLEPEECEQQADAFLARQSGFQRFKLTDADLSGVTGLISPADDLRSLPFMAAGDQPGMDGFYAARLLCTEPV